MDKEIRQFSNAIIGFINSNPLPIEVKRLALKDIYNQVDEQATLAIRAQIEEEQKKEQEIKAESEVEE